jgi:cell division protein FtsL
MLQDRRITKMTLQRDSLNTARVQLEQAIRNASGRTRMVPIAEQQLKMRVPKPEQQITLPRPQLPKKPPASRNQ